MNEHGIAFLQTNFPNASIQNLSDLSASSDQNKRCLNKTTHVHSALLQAVNFDKVKEEWYQKRFHDQVKSCDALYYHDDNYYLLEFKTGEVNGLDVFRKIYDSIIGLMEHNKLTLEDCRKRLNVILIANHAEQSTNAAYMSHLQLQSDWDYTMTKAFLKTLKDNDIRRLTNYLVKWAYRMTPDEFEAFVQEKGWSN